MKKVSLIVHQNYVEDVIKSLHENGTMEIIDISKDEPDILKESEKSGMHPEASVCSNYELRLTRIIHSGACVNFNVKTVMFFSDRRYADSQPGC